jgi:para-nitrobenzyl esterase
MSGSFLGSTPQKEAREIGVETAKNLGISADNIDSIQRVPYEKLLEASNKAFKEVSQRNRDKHIGHGIRLGWGPINDGDIMPGIFENGSERINNDVPLLIGSTLNEFSGAEIDKMVRPAVKEQATIRCKDGGAPVYVYLSGYQVPTMDGSFHACHNSDIPFFFNNVEKSASMTGATEEGIALGEKMSNALLNFARTGNPNAKGLPEWPAFTPDKPATMYFDAPKCEVIVK